MLTQANNTTPFTFIDLCAGIGGFHLGLTKVGGCCILASEIDEAARATYARNFPSTPLAGDLWELAADPLRLVPPHDLLAAGLPCQPFSKQGKERSIADPRGHLFFAVLAIVCAHHPRYVVLENVRNLAARPHRATWDLMVRSLRACGYRTSNDPVVMSPHLLPPELGGSPQRRERAFLLAEFVGEDTSPAELVSPPVLQAGQVAGWDPERWRAELILQPESELDRPERYRLSPVLGQIIDVWDSLVRALPPGAIPSAFPLWADHLRNPALIPAGTPAWRRPIIERNRCFYLRHRAVIDHWLATSGIELLMPSRRQLDWHAGTARNLRQLVLRLRTTGLTARPATWLPTLLTSTQEPILGWRRRRIPPREAARLQGFPDDFQLPDRDRAAYRQLGNAVHPGVVARVVGHVLAHQVEIAKERRAA